MDINDLLREQGIIPKGTEGNPFRTGDELAPGVFITKIESVGDVPPLPFEPDKPVQTGAICQDCGQDMMLAAGCTKTTVSIDGKQYERQPYDPERLPDEHYRCHDCNAEYGKLHHLGCDVETCPNCSGQLIACGCWLDDEPS